MSAPRMTREVMQEAVDQVALVGGNILHASRVMGIPGGTLQCRIRNARQNGITASVLPKAIDLSEPQRHLTGERTVLIMGDVHVPYHDETTVHHAIEYGLKHKADTVILNGDIIDCAAVSHHEKTPEQRAGFHTELDKTREMLSTFRKTFPKAEIIYNEGNHEQRLPRWMAVHAPELWSLAELQLPSLLHLSQYRITWSPSMQRLSVGELTVIHGHEYRRGGVHVAHTTGREAAANIIQSHHHRSQESMHRAIDDKVMGSWTIGCACQIHQPWLVFNQWVQGFALIEVESDGRFVTHNRKVIQGRLY